MEHIRIWFGADKDASGADSRVREADKGAPHADKGRQLEQIEGATTSEFWKPLLSFLGDNI